MQNANRIGGVNYHFCKDKSDFSTLPIIGGFTMYKYILLFFLMLMPFRVPAQTAEWRHLHQGNRAFMKGDYKTAELEYRSAQRINPRSARAAFNLGDVYLAQKNPQAALEQYQVAAKGETNKYLKALSYHNVGVVYHLNKQYDKAIDFYKEALRNNPHDEDTRYNLVLCQKQKKDSQEQQQQQNKKEEKQEQNNQKKQKNQQQKSQQEEKKGGMSKESAERLLNLSQQAEQQTRDKLHRAEQPRQKQLIKNW